MRRYWELSVTTPIHYARDEEYVERLPRIARRRCRRPPAHEERRRTDERRTGLANRGSQRPAGLRCAMGIIRPMRAYTEVFDSLIPHEERHYAKLVADALKIPIEFLVSDHWKIFERADQPEYHTPEPTHSALPDTNCGSYCGRLPSGAASLLPATVQTPRSAAGFRFTSAS